MEAPQKCILYLVTPSEKRNPSIPFVNTTSQSKEEWQRGLSPFFLGPISLYSNYTSKNMENAWQYAKVYEDHTDPTTGDPTPAYYTWAKQGWENPKPVRFPNGRGAIPEYSYWDDKKYGYIAARIAIYCPLYAQLVEQTIAFQKLKKIYKTSTHLYLIDFDGYDYHRMGKTLNQCLLDPKKKWDIHLSSQAF
eukprot:TRINITY_DN2803_c0_g1_i2.p1 TRINITY_DN2803_c0_g1~~TRINITY_DN2803_c0_g1_i2.p1  ORF type:complete len:192 (-),score=36.51 TRINITY_DN2803_c0_g1_i2:161-736(-)